MAAPSGTVWARPSRLHRYRDDLLEVDVELLLRGSGLGDTLSAYAYGNPDGTADHGHLADEVVLHGRGCLVVDLHVGAVAAAFDAIDGYDRLGPRSVPAAKLDRRLRQYIRAREEDDLHGLLIPLDDDTWEELVWGPGGAPECVAGTYGGGGAILGPDGRLWPIVIPEVEWDDRTIHAIRSDRPHLDPRTLGGTDPGWFTVDRIEGVTRLKDPPGLLGRFGVFSLGGGFSNFRPRPDLLPNLSIDEHGFPHLHTAAGDATASYQGRDAMSRSDALAEGLLHPERATLLVGGRQVAVDPRRISHYPDDVRRSFHQHRTGNAPRSVAPGAARQRQAGRARSGLDLLEGAASGKQAVDDLDQSGFVRYQVTYASHPDGRRRADIRAYRVQQTNTSDPKLQVRPMHLHLDGDRLVETPMGFDDPRTPDPGWQPDDGYQVVSRTW